MAKRAKKPADEQTVTIKKEETYILRGDEKLTEDEIVSLLEGDIPEKILGLEPDDVTIKNTKVF